MLNFTYLILAFIIGTLIAGKVRWHCTAIGMVNEVNERSSHKKPTVRGGGLTFPVIMVPFSLTYLYFSDMPSILTSFLVPLTLLSILIAWIGWLDDKKPRTAKVRLLAQFFSVGICLFFLPTMFADFIPLWVEKTLLFLAWVWFINLYNFLDGLDGYAAIEGVFICFALLLISPMLAPFVLVLAGVLLGFLRLNFHPAKVFMGDVGSTYLGFLLGGFLLLASSLNPAEIIPIAFLLPALFTFDATYTLIKRLVGGHKPWEAHKEHWYQRAHTMGLSHRQVFGKGLLINLAIFAFILLGLYLKIELLAPVCVVILLAGVAIRIRYLEGK